MSHPVLLLTRGLYRFSACTTVQACQVTDEGKPVSQQTPAQQGKAPSLDETTREGGEGSATETTRRVKIFEGGYKSNEEYVYVRGRGRGKYVCEECGIRCRKPSMLRKHIRSHSDLRPYRCNICRFSFKTKGNLTKHMKSKTHSKKCGDTGVTPSTSLDEADDDFDTSGYTEGEKGDDSEDDNESDDDDEEEEEGSIDSTEILPVAAASQDSASEQHLSGKPLRPTGPAPKSPSEHPAAGSPTATDRECGAARREAVTAASSPSLFSHLPLHSQLQAERTLLPVLQVGSGGGGHGGSVQLLAPGNAALLPAVPVSTLAGGGGFIGGGGGGGGITSLRCVPIMSLPLATKSTAVKALPRNAVQVQRLLVPAEGSGAGGKVAVDGSGQEAARECRLTHNGHTVAVTLARASEPTGV